MQAGVKLGHAVPPRLTCHPSRLYRETRADLA
jgi:hypothetical protein